MTDKPDRTPCLNLRCRRTFKREHQVETVVCGKCWRTLPLAWRQRDRALRARWRRVERLEKRKHRSGIRNTRRQVWRMGLQYRRLFDANWQRIHAFFLAPEKPIGLEAFLEELAL